MRNYSKIEDVEFKEIVPGAKREPNQEDNYGLLDPRFKYTHSSKTDIRELFNRVRAAWTKK